jgi:mycothiol S-conjugate amidase
MPVDAPSAALRLMAVHAHPDDESSKGAATMARYVREGVDVLVVTCTGGEAGSILNPELEGVVSLEDLPAVRLAEMAAAREILGVRQEWLGFVDSGLPEGDPPPPLPDGCFALVPLAESQVPLVRLIRAQRPQVLLTYDEKGGYPHPDHIRTHEISMAAVTAAADPGYRPDLGEPWAVSKIYYHMTFTKERVAALHEACLAIGIESPWAKWLEDWKDDPTDTHHVTTRVPCSEYFGLRDRALLAHASQVDPNGRWFLLPLEVQASAWPTEDFMLASSTVEVPADEDDLFAGLRVG